MPTFWRGFYVREKCSNNVFPYKFGAIIMIIVVANQRVIHPSGRGCNFDPNPRPKHLRWRVCFALQTTPPPLWRIPSHGAGVSVFVFVCVCVYWPVYKFAHVCVWVWYVCASVYYNMSACVHSVISRSTRPVYDGRGVGFPVPPRELDGGEERF